MFLVYIRLLVECGIIVIGIFLKSKRFLICMLDEITQKEIPTTIDLKVVYIYPDSRGLWLRIRDNCYYNSLCPGVSFDLSVFESLLNQNKAEILSYNAHSKETLLNMFPEKSHKQMHQYVLELYLSQK